MSVSEFVLRNAVEQAQTLVQQHEAVTLSQQDFAAFLDALDALAGRAGLAAGVCPPRRPGAEWRTAFVR